MTKDTGVNIEKILHDSIARYVQEAIQKHCKECNRDFTYVCDVTKVHGDNKYQITYDSNTIFNIETKNIVLNLHDKVHLVVPCGDFKNKYLLEDMAINMLLSVDD